MNTEQRTTDELATDRLATDELERRFIALRTQGWSYSRIAANIGVSKPTLIKWGRKHAFTINNLRAIHTEEIVHQVFGEKQARWESMARQLRKLEEEIEKRDLGELSTCRLHELAIRLRKEIAAQSAVPKMAENAATLDEGEYVYSRTEWEA